MSEIPQGRHLSSKPVLERNKFLPVAVGTEQQCEVAIHPPCGSRVGKKCGEKGARKRKMSRNEVVGLKQRTHTRN